MTFINHFGSIEQAQIAADLPPYRLKTGQPKQLSDTIFSHATLATAESQIVGKKPTGRPLTYTKENLISQFVNLAQQLGRRLLIKDIRQASKNNQSASLDSFQRLFGSSLNIPCSLARVETRGRKRTKN